MNVKKSLVSTLRAGSHPKRQSAVCQPSSCSDEYAAASSHLTGVYATSGKSDEVRKKYIEIKAENIFVTALDLENTALGLWVRQENLG